MIAGDFTVHLVKETQVFEHVVERELEIKKGEIVHKVKQI
jgi:hypothetical protein